MKLIYSFYLLVFNFCIVSSQVGIGTESPSSSSILHINSLNSAIRLPKIANITTINSNPNNFEKGSLFFSLENNENCIRYIKSDLKASNCLITTEEIATALSFNETSSNMNVSSTAYQDLVNFITVPPQFYLRTFSINIDALRKVSVSSLGSCSSVDFRIIKHNNIANTNVVLFKTTSSIIPRYANENDVFSYSNLVVGQIFPNEDVTFHFQYRDSNACTNNTVNLIKSAEMQVVVY